MTKQIVWPPEPRPFFAAPAAYFTILAFIS